MFRFDFHIEVLFPFRLWLAPLNWREVITGMSLVSEQFDLAGCHVGLRSDFNTGGQTLSLSCRRDRTG